MTGRDLTSQAQAKPNRYLIDLNKYDLIEALQFRSVHKRILQMVLPTRKQKAQKEQDNNAEALQSNPQARLKHQSSTISPA
ncbi:MAG: hypothetical protein MUF87_22235 [Anaerolineae bacterium]|nr:hypothetical protein [Anaerolineae bacterium]